MKIVVNDSHNLIGNFVWDTPKIVDQNHEAMTAAVSKMMGSCPLAIEQVDIESIQQLIRQFLYTLTIAYSTGPAFPVMLRPRIRSCLDKLEKDTVVAITDPNLKDKAFEVFAEEMIKIIKELATGKRIPPRRSPGSQR